MKMRDLPIYLLVGVLIGYAIHTNDQLTKLQEQQSNLTANQIRLHDNDHSQDQPRLGKGELPPKAPDGETWFRTNANRELIGDGPDGPTPFCGQLYGTTFACISDSSNGNIWDLYTLFDETGQKIWYAKLLPIKGGISPSFINYKKPSELHQSTTNNHK
jgi:hypothetical protein